MWADCVRPMERFNYSAPWHYQNVNVCQPFDLKGPCKDGNCVSAQIDRQARLLADPAVPQRDKVMALAFLIHFVGDLHQPMHAGDQGDLGGNRVAMNYGLIGGRTNLHGVWDGWLAERAITTPPGRVAGLLSETTAASRAEIAGGQRRGLEPRAMGEVALARLCDLVRRSVRRAHGATPDADRGAGPGADPRGARQCAGGRAAAGAAARRCARARGQGARAEALAAGPKIRQTKRAAG